MHQKQTIRAIGYARVSIEELANSDLSLISQRIRIAGYAQASDFDLIEIIEESGWPATNMNRPGLQRALQTLEDGLADALVVTSLDRLTRSVKVLGHLVEFFDRTKIALVSVLDSIDSLSSSGRLVLNVLGSIAQWERKAMVERTTAALAAKVNKGEKTGGTVPYGFDVSPSGKLLPNSREQEAVHVMVHGHRKGLSLRKIGDLLAKRGFLPKQGGAWHPQVIKKILTAHFRGK